MKNKNPKLKIVLICDQVQRELPALQLLKKQLLKDHFSVSIIGSLAEINRMYFLLHKIKPDIVFISQIQEKITRDIAQYVKNSGGKICVLPMELSYSRANLFWLYNQRLNYDDLIDYYLLPGEQFRTDLNKFTDIDTKKMFTVGSPKMDLLFIKNEKSFLNREKFCQKYNIPLAKKNIFIYTTFIASTIDYIKKEDAFKGNVKATLRIYKCIEETKKIFLKDIERLCLDFPDCNIILKPHPLERVDDYLNINHDNFYLIQKELFNDTVKSIDLAIHWNSTVATECWIQGKKTIQYAPVSKYKDLLSEFKTGNPVCQNYDELKLAIDKYLKSKMDKKYVSFQRNYLKLWYYCLDGKSAKRISNILNNIVKYNLPKQYFKNYPSAFILFLFLDKILGPSVVRTLVKLFKKNYQRQYALENYVLDKSYKEYG